MLPQVVPADQLPFLLRVISPALVLSATLSLIFTRERPSADSSPITSVVVANAVPRRAVILTLLSLIALTFFLDGATLVAFAVIRKHWPPWSGIDVNTLVGVAAFAGLAALGAIKDVQGVEVWTLKRVRSAIGTALSLDVVLTILLGMAIKTWRTAPPPHVPEAPPQVPIDTLLHFVFPAIRVILLLPLSVALQFPRIVYTAVNNNHIVEPVPTSSSFLLPNDLGPRPSAGLSTLGNEVGKYGTFRQNRPSWANWQRPSTLPSLPTTRAATPAPSTAADNKTDAKPDISLEPSWTEMWQRIKRLTPYLWPSKSPYLQFLALLCVVVLLIGRFVNAALPFTIGQLVLIFEGGSNWSLWLVLLVYVGLSFLQGSGGLSAIREMLWTPVLQYSDREMSQLSFEHLLNLSFAWHMRRKTGEVLRVLDRGAAINHALEVILFNILPTVIDIIVALVIFCLLFEWTLAAVIFVVMAAYIYASIELTRWRTRLRRQMNERDVISRGIHADCLLNYETVKYFGGEEHEGARYREAIHQYQLLEYKVIMSLNLLNLVQNFIITIGLLLGSFIVAHRVTTGVSEPHEFIVFITYLAQLYGPLNQLGYIYRSMNQSLVDTEKLLTLLSEPTEVNDVPNAPDLIVTDGVIEFDNVSFSYDGRSTALNGVSFKVPKGSSVALVGESGAGKSTIMRLLYRFYDLKEGEGRILVDGQDIREVTQKSLRQAIGVVPQDSVLFNSSIAYNIGYGKFGSSLHEVEEAARLAHIHDRIMSFPDGYETVVGERGVRLSGGEKQRVAIARTLLKNPPILLLDEATSALDTSTEKDIQKALQNLVKGRSSVSIAHRLSTIASADLILVVRDGRIVEKGTHKELLDLNGVFATMWSDQVSASGDAPVASSSSSKKEPSGYHVDASVAPTQDQVTTDVPETIEPTEPTEVVAESPPQGLKPLPPAPPAEYAERHVENTPVAFPSSDTPEQQSTTDDVSATEPTPVAFPTSPASAPIAFPGSSDDAPTTPPSSPPPHAVTFGYVATPVRSGTPDPDSEPKRKRMSSQNFQRLARRISITTRRQGSVAGAAVASIIPGLKRNESARASTDEGNGSHSNILTDSPSGSLSDKKKEKKEKKRKSTIG